MFSIWFAMKRFFLSNFEEAKKGGRGGGEGAEKTKRKIIMIVWSRPSCIHIKHPKPYTQ